MSLSDPWTGPESLLTQPVYEPPKCKVHCQYKVIRRPRTACEACWRLWIAKNP